jgi:hypothetical protein
MSHVFGVWIVGFSDRVKEDLVDILLSSVFHVFKEQPYIAEGALSTRDAAGHQPKESCSET